MKGPGADIQRLALLSVLASGLGVAGSIARSKVTAVVLGPAGFGRAAEVLQVVNTAFVPLALVGGPALVAALARARDLPDGEARRQRVLDTAGTLVAGGSIVLALAAAIASAFTFDGWSATAVRYALLASAGLALGAFGQLPVQLLLGGGHVKQHAALTVVSSVALAVLTCAATWFLGLDGQFLALAAAPLVALVLAAVFAKRAVPSIRLLPKPVWDATFVRESLAIGATTLIAGYALQGALTAVRATLAVHGGAEANGHFQAAWAMGATYFGVVLNGLATTIFPRYSAARDEAELGREVEGALRLVFLLAPPLILVAIALREPVVHLLYSSSFDRAAEIAGLQMAGDLAKAVSWALAGPLLYRGRVKAYLVVELAWAALYVGLTTVLVPRIGVEGTGWAYGAAYVAYVPLTAWVASRSLGIRVPWKPVAATVAFTVLASAAVLATKPFPLVRAGLVVAGVAWALKGGLAELVLGRLVRRLRPAAAGAGTEVER